VGKAVVLRVGKGGRVGVRKREVVWVGERGRIVGGEKG
jgi:hypothetical protein